MKWILIALAVFTAGLTVPTKAQLEMEQAQAIVGDDCTVIAKYEDDYVCTDGDIMFLSDGITDNKDLVLHRNAMVSEISEACQPTDCVYVDTDGNKADILICTEQYKPEIALYVEGKYDTTPMFLSVDESTKEAVRELQYRWFGIGLDYEQVKRLLVDAIVLN